MSHPVAGVGSWLYVWGSICWELGKLSTLGLPRAMGDRLKCPVLGQRELHSPRVLLLAPNPSPAPYLVPAASEQERPGVGGDTAGLPKDQQQWGMLAHVGIDGCSCLDDPCPC